MDDKKPTEPKQQEKDLPAVDQKEDNQPSQSEWSISHAPTPHVVKVKKSPIKTVAVVLLIIALAGLSAYLGYLYLQEKDNAKNLQQQINSSQSSTSSPDQNSTVNASTSNEISYTAEVGKFTLTLPNKYVIIKNIDGGFEGGPATSLDIAVKSDTPGVANSSAVPNRIVSVSDKVETLDVYIEGINQGYPDIVELPSLKVDGVDAKVYRLEGLFEINRIFFEKNNIYYQFETLAPESKDELSADMKAIIEGFKFNRTK